MASKQRARRRALYRRQGYIVVPSVLDPLTVRRLRLHADWVRRRHADLRAEHLYKKRLWDDPFWLSAASDPRLLDLAEDILGPDIALMSSSYFIKPPGKSLPVLWHQDGGWKLEPMNMLSAWIALDDADERSGGLRVIPGSHEQSFRVHRRTPDHANAVPVEIDGAVDASAAVSLELKAGGLVLFHPHLIHGSPPNLSPRPRRALAVRYIPTSTRVTWPWDAYLLRGKARRSVNTYVAFPAFKKGLHYPGPALPRRWPAKP